MSDKLEIRAKDNSVAAAEINSSAVAQTGGTAIVENISVKNEIGALQIFVGSGSNDEKIGDNLKRAIDEVKSFLEQNKPLKALDKIAEIEKSFDGLITGIAKFRLLSNKGLALTLTGSTEKGADLLLAAFEVDNKSETAHVNRIRAYYLKKDRMNFNKAISEIPIDYNTSDKIAGSILEAIQMDKSLDKFPDFIKDYHFNDAMNCLFANRFYSIRGNDSEALKYLEKAMNLKPDDWQILGLYGSELLWQEQKNLNTRLLSFMPIEQRQRVEKATELLKKSWDYIKDAEFDFSIISHIPINLASAYRILNKQDEEKEIINRLLQEMPDDPEIIIKKITTLSPTDQLAAEYVEKLNPSESSDYAVVVAMVYMQKGDYKKALNALIKAPNDSRREPSQIPIMKMECLKELRDTNSAAEILKGKNTPAVKTFLKYIFYGKPDILIKAYNSLGQKDGGFIRFEIALKLFDEKKYREAAILFKQLIKSSSVNDLVYRQYLRCLWEARLLTDLKTELDKIPENELDDTLKGLRANYYIEIKDYQKAISILEELFSSDPSNASYIVHLLFAYRVVPNHKKIQDLLNKIPEDINSLSGNFVVKWQIILFLKEYAKDLKLTAEKAYELVARNMDKESAWLGYFGFFLMDIPKVELDEGITYFVLRDESTKQAYTYIIEDNPDIKSTKFFDVLRSTDSKTKKLLSANINDFVSFSDNGMGTKLRVVQISNKYIGLGFIIRDRIDTEFPNCGVIKLSVKDNNVDEVIEFCKQQNNKQLNAQNRFGDMYKNQAVLYTSMLAGMTGNNIISVLHMLEREKFHVALGNDEEKKYSKQVSAIDKPFIIDALTIYNIFEFGVQDIIENLLSDRIYVTQNTKEIIKRLIEEFKENISKRTGRLITEPDSDKMIFATFEDLEEFYKARLDQLKAMLDWLNSKAHIAKPSGNIELDETKKLLISTFQEFDAETAAIVESALEYGLNLLSDDLKLRQIARHIFNIDGIWVQGLLMNKRISKHKYAKLVVDSVKRNHTFITFDSEVLSDIIVMDDYKNIENFKIVVKRLAESSTESAVRVFFEFYNKFIKSVGTDFAHSVLSVLIDGFLQQGCHKELESRLVFLKVMAENEELLSDILDRWLAGHAGLDINIQ